MQKEEKQTNVKKKCKKFSVLPNLHCEDFLPRTVFVLLLLEQNTNCISCAYHIFIH